ncbi:MAG: hypothetical protein GAK37_01366 [Pseudomonas sp.]|nr:MAG: hypothetical protein GAK37_01366 [Pseudomonas sp.]
MIRGVDTPGTRVDLLRQAVGIGAFELAHAAVLHQHLGQQKVVFGQLGQHFLGGRRLPLAGLLQHGQAEFFIENRAELLGRTQVELFAGDLECLALQLDHLVTQLDALHAQQVFVHQRALALDTRQHRHQRDLDVCQHTGQARNGRQLRVQGLMQAQRHVGVFGRIRARLLKGDLVERQLLGAFTGDVLEGHGVVVQVLFGQAVHVVPGGGGVEHVGLKHRIERNAAHGDALRRVAADGAVGQDVHVELGVLAHLELGRVFQQRLQGQQHGVAVQLVRHADVGMGQRDVGRFVGLNRERNPHQLRLLGVDAGGFGVEGEQFGVVELFQPHVESRLVEDGFVHRLGRLGHNHCFGSGNGGRRFSLEFHALGIALDLVIPALELQQGVQLKQLLAVRLAQVQVVQAHVQRHVHLDGGQLVGQERHFLVLFELGRQGLGSANRQGRDDIQLRIKLFQAAIDAHQQAGSRLGTNTRNARDVVGRITHQRQIVDDLLGCDAELFLHALDVHRATGHGVDQGNVPVHQLRHVLVTGRNHHRTVGRCAAAGQGADHVVGLYTLDAQQRETQGDHALVQRLDLQAHLVGHAGTVGFVFGVHFIAKCPTLGVENDGKRAVRVLLAQAFEHVQHALDRAGGQAFGGGQRWQRVKGAVQIRRTVHQDEGCLAHEQDQPFRRVRR